MPTPVVTLTASSGRVVTLAEGEAIPPSQYVTETDTLTIAVQLDAADAADVKSINYFNAAKKGKLEKLVDRNWTDKAPHRIEWTAPAAGTPVLLMVELVRRAKPNTKSYYRVWVRPHAPAVVEPPKSDADKPTLPVGNEVETPKPGKRAVRGTIIEHSEAYAPARAAGFTLFREWMSINWSTGRINDPKDVRRCNDLIKAGDAVILTVTPNEASSRRGERCPDFSVVADQIIAGGLDKRVIVQLANEPNLTKKDSDGNRIGTYYPDGDVTAATKEFAVPIGIKLKAAGYTLACPSITWGDPAQITKWVDAIFANSPAGLWDYLDGHAYLSGINEMRRVFTTYRDLATKHGVKLMSSEWSRKIGNDAFVGELPACLRVMDEMCDIHCWFSYTFGEKFNPMNPYAWRDGKTTVVHDAWSKAMT